jgi:ABC-type microcin C transport system duplicated ATPase subunit YejF
LPAISTDNLSRVFKTNTGIVRRKQKEIVALDGVSLSVESGELFGLLGLVYASAAWLMFRHRLNTARSNGNIELI